MQFQEILEKKRDRNHLTKAEIQFFVESYTSNSLPDYQASAFLMAVFLNGLNPDETAWLTEAMLYSGIVVDLSNIPGTKVDKHSTGGVGDKTSLIIAPICAALGVPVPMISGRGLGHTGGTLDKLEAIPGFNVDLNLEQYRKLVEKHGLCLIGQTSEIAPADKKLYALRDVTATVENRSLIAASIMSKKLAEGIDALVLDVKVGRGAFMKTIKEAELLGKLMIAIGNKVGKNVIALLSDMNQPLGMYVGNALEVFESIAVLKGDTLPEQQDLVELSIQLAAHMIVLGGKADSVEDAKNQVSAVIKNGKAFSKFADIVKEQGGDVSFLKKPQKLLTAGSKETLTADRDGYIKRLDALTIGKGALYLGAGRVSLNSLIDPAVGVVVRKKTGDRVKKGDVILEIHYNRSQQLADSKSYFKNAITISDNALATKPLIKKVLS